MNKNILNGQDILLMIENGMKALQLDIDRINALNVFPVPDGDTGTNMNLTISGGVNEGKKENILEVGPALKKIVRGMVMNARGNSGVILSQFFKGFSKDTAELETVNLEQFANMLENAWKRSYEVVAEPTEGTMLTVMREAALNTHFEEQDDIYTYLNKYLENAKKSLLNTPNLLPVLKEAGVIDSGGAGFVLIIEGMLMALKDEFLDVNVDQELTTIQEIEDQYVFDDIEKKYGIVCVSSGEGISEVYKELGADIVLFGGQTMNTSTADFLEAFKKINAKTIFVYPNNPNIIMAANQAKENYTKSEIIVIPTRTIIEGYSALGMLQFPDEVSSSEVLEFQKEIIANLNTLEVTYAIRDSKYDGIEIKKDDYICLLNDKLIASASTRSASMKLAFSKMPSIKTSEVITVFYGLDINEENLLDLENYIHELNKFAEVYMIPGKQNIYSYIIGLE